MSNLILLFLATMKVSAELAGSFLVSGIILAVLVFFKVLPYSSESRTFNHHSLLGVNSMYTSNNLYEIITEKIIASLEKGSFLGLNLGKMQAYP